MIEYVSMTGLHGKTSQNDNESCSALSRALITAFICYICRFWIWFTLPSWFIHKWDSCNHKTICNGLTFQSVIPWWHTPVNFTQQMINLIIIFWLDLKPVPQLLKILSRNVEYSNCHYVKANTLTITFTFIKLTKNICQRIDWLIVSSNSSVPLFNHSTFSNETTLWVGVHSNKVAVLTNFQLVQHSPTAILNHSNVERSIRHPLTYWNKFSRCFQGAGWIALLSTTKL